jgi:two-component system cell cycle sensor histidine kinase/response regulator CckA
VTSFFQRTSRWTRGFLLVDGLTRWLVVLAGLFTLAEIVRIAAGATEFPHAYAVSKTLYLSTAALAVALAARTAWSCRGQRRAFAAWTFLASSLGLFFFGEVSWLIADVVQNGVESPAWADIGYLAYYPVLAIALVLLSIRSNEPRERLRIGLDVATIFSGGGLLVWYFVLRPSLANLGSGLAAAVVVAYPVGDLLLIMGIAALALRRNLFRSGQSLFTLLMAVLVGFVADLAFGYTSSLGTYDDAGAIDTVYLAAWFLLAFAAALEHSARAAGNAVEPLERPVRSASRSLVFSYLAIGFAIAVLIWAVGRVFSSAETPAAVVAVVITILAMARQVVAMRESSRLREQQAVAASEERFQHVLRRTQFSVDHAADPILWFDPVGHIVDANETATRRLEYSKDELVGMSILDIDLHIPHDPELLLENWHALRDQGLSTLESEYRTKSGLVFPVAISASHLEYAGEQYVCSFAHDITIRRQNQAALRQAEEQLRQAQKLDAIGQLAGGIAHDFNNLLAVILGYSEMILLSGDEVGDPVRKAAQAIKSAADRGATLTRQILLFSRRQPLKPRVIGINDIVAEAEQLLGRTLGEHIELITVLDPNAGHVEVDEAEVIQSITNLAVNARDAMPQGGRLCIETSNLEIDADFCAHHPDLRPGPYVMLAVSDTGSGMDVHTRSRAFEPFFTTKDVGKGTGLGLAAVYGTVRQSKGTALIYSEPGFGTTIKIYLPRVTEAPAEGPDDPPTASTAVVQGTDAPSRLMTLLVVEDEAAIRELITQVLESRGYRVLSAGTADEAVSVLEENAQAIDMLLTDVILPGSMQGGELARRALALRPGLPVLYMSGYTRDVVLRAGRLQDGMHYLEKPFSMEVLVRRVRDILSQGSGSGGSEAGETVS